MDTQKNEALFKLTQRALGGTTHSRFQILTGWSVSLFLVLYGFYNIKDTPDVNKILSLTMILISCYSAVNLSGFIRDRNEGEYLQLHCKDTSLYSPSHVKTLIGSNARYLLHYTVFL